MTQQFTFQQIATAFDIALPALDQPIDLSTATVRDLTYSQRMYLLGFAQCVGMWMLSNRDQARHRLDDDGVEATQRGLRHHDVAIRVFAARPDMSFEAMRQEDNWIRFERTYMSLPSTQDRALRIPRRMMLNNNDNLLYLLAKGMESYYFPSLTGTLVLEMFAQWQHIKSGASRIDAFDGGRPVKAGERMLVEGVGTFEIQIQGGRVTLAEVQYPDPVPGDRWYDNLGKVEVLMTSLPWQAVDLTRGVFITINQSDIGPANRWTLKTPNEVK